MFAKMPPAALLTRYHDIVIASEAKQSMQRRGLDCFVACAPRNGDGQV
jgi:hypothetical protein